MSYEITDRVRRVLIDARKAASARSHREVRPEHLLFALLGQDRGLAVAVLQALSADQARLRHQVEDRFSSGQAEARPSAVELPYTSDAKQALELAMYEAAGLDHSYVGTGHLLLGVLRLAHGPAVEILDGNGLTLHRLQAEMKRIVAAQAPEGSVPESERAPGFVAACWHWLRQRAG